MLEVRAVNQHNQGDYPSSYTELLEYCASLRSVRDGYRFAPGLAFPDHEALLNPAIQEILINGRFGVQKLDFVTGTVVARSGFDVDEDTMVIGHTPQGVWKDNLTRDERNRIIRAGRFRLDMIEIMVETARSLGLKEVVGIAAANHYKVWSGRFLSLEQGVRVMDDQYLALNFGRNCLGNFVLNLH